MNRRWGTLAIGVILALGAPNGAAAADGTGLRAMWPLDEVGVPPRAIDSSAFDNHGINDDVLGTGNGYQFNGTSSRVVVDDSASLDPGPADFSFGATLVMKSPPPRGETYDVLRKGLVNTVGGEYKLEITHVNGAARARCVIKDAKNVRVTIVAPTNLSNGAPHSVTCLKTSKTLSVKIDSLAARTVNVTALGSISNSSKLGLGAKAGPTASTGFDWYRGLIRDAWVRVG